jgi:hypothetical protein
MPDATDFSLLIPELPAWNNGDGIDIDSWLRCEGDFPLAIAFSRLFWPSFAEHDGCIFYSEFSLATYHSFLTACAGDKASVERVMNHRHILHLFSHPASTVTADQLVFLGKVLKEILAVKLSHDFPNRSFEIGVDEGPLDDLEDYQLTFWQPKNEPSP